MFYQCLSYHPLDSKVEYTLAFPQAKLVAVISFTLSNMRQHCPEEKEMFRTQLYFYYHCQSIHQFLQGELVGSVPVNVLQKFLFVETEKFHGIVLAFMMFLSELDFVVCSSYKRSSSSVMFSGFKTIFMIADCFVETG